MTTARAAKCCVLIFLLFPVAAFADGWQQYSNVMSRYYLIDQQSFSQITCDIEAQPLRNSIEQIRQQLSGLTDKVRMTETLDKYQLVFDKKNGLSFKDPAISIDILSEKGMADPAKVKNGIGEIVHGFDQEVQGTDTQLKGLFEDYESTKQGDIAVDGVEVTSDGVVLKYRKDGSTFTDTIRGSATHTVQTLPSGVVTSDSSYKGVTGAKLILDSFDMKMDQPLQTISMHASITYQSLDGIMFPDEITEHGTVDSVQAIQTTFLMTIKLTNCQLHQ